MAKEAKTKTLAVDFNYDGLSMTLTDVVKDYELEEAVKALANQVKLLTEIEEIAVGMD